MAIAFNVPVVPGPVSNVPVPLMPPPVSEPLVSVSWPPVLMVSTPASVALPLSLNAPPTFMLLSVSAPPDASETFAFVAIELLPPESV